MPQSALIASRPDVWRGRRLKRDLPVIASGHEALDRQLPCGGWPLGGLTELLTNVPGAGEFSLLLPALAEATSNSRWAVLIDPPWLPYPPAMRGHGVSLEHVILVRTRNAREGLWSCEQALRAARGGIVIAWPEKLSFSRLRRLQLAASAGHKAAFLFRPDSAADEPTPAVLRLRVSADPLGACITVLKCRGRRPDTPVLIRRHHLPGIAAAATNRETAAAPATTPLYPSLQLPGKADTV
ncbi:MAG: translesion DNA synthesis-associated protein ImuA [Xanthomonadales bacterium]|nr:translesion DNA synthesis-associated protein ImuA [Xanthomonadales bacterium]